MKNANPSRKLARWLLIAIAVLLVLICCVFMGRHFATQMLRDKVVQALGPAAELSEMTVGFSSIEIRGLRIKAPKGWPVADTLRAERIIIAPDLSALVTANVGIRRIDIEGAYVSVLRSREGKLRMVPSLLESASEKKTSDKPAGVPVSIGLIALSGAVIDFFDGTVRDPPHRIRIEPLQARLDNLHVPALDGRMKIDIAGTIKGPQRDGKLAIAGWLELAAKNSEITTQLRGADLVMLQPYLIKAAETGVKKGSLDLDIKSTVHNNQINAPGTVTLSGLELDSAGGAFPTFMGMPRAAVVAALKNRNDQIAVSFKLKGDLNDPKFSLNASVYRQIASVVAETLGISLEGLVRGLGTNAGEGAGKIGDTLRKLFAK